MDIRIYWIGPFKSALKTLYTHIDPSLGSSSHFLGASARRQPPPKKMTIPPPNRTASTRNALAIACLLVFVALTNLAHAATYAGSLSSGNGLSGTDAWSDGSSLSWFVTDDGNDCAGWRYSYTLTVVGHDISHVIMEAADTMQYSDFTHDVGGLQMASYELGDYGPTNPSNPEMPGSMRAIRVNAQSGVRTLTWSFCTDRSPVWGDFYVQQGVDENTEGSPLNGPGGYPVFPPSTVPPISVTPLPDISSASMAMVLDGDPQSPPPTIYLHNTGFTENDTDPMDALARDGTVNFHLLVPGSDGNDSETLGVIPEPSTGMLVGMSLLLLWHRKVVNPHK